MNDYIRGVNLGGWLILEKWMTPTLFKDFDGEDEHSFMQNDGAAGRINKHRKTFITESDFAWMSEHHINLVRIPIGYWLFETSHGHTPTVNYVDKAMEWAEKYGINVLIDLHGAPGSQNGKDHGGKHGKALWFTNAEYEQQTIDLLCKIASRYKNSKALWGIELLNEPKVSQNYFKLIWFYRRAYGELRKIMRPGTYTIFQDGFHAIMFSGALWPRKNYPVAMDTHWYAFHPFSNSESLYRRILAFYRGLILRYVRLFQPVIIGEWSSVFPGRYFDQLPAEKHDELLAKNMDSQLKMFKNADGWIYWNYKHEGEGMWNFRSLVEQGIFDNRHLK